MDPAPGQAARRLPPDCEAFLTLHCPRYLRYARLHLPPAEADAAVAAVFDELFTSWRRVLAHPNPAAYAWWALTSRTRRQPDEWAALAPDAYDAVALRHLLGYPLAEVAAAMGAEPEAVHTLLRGPAVAAVLRRAGPVPGPRPAP
ncbi:hypothetical protein [Streptomyces radicis]|uniref:Sigma-70 family RNA polymerase sigma factor n=1 Tax=Streptomyces radicis TaxID=1750517 RepID=A0A3A9W1F3_9ACTN|nr:hypothetical protein [Streptomyces radicis]RKN07055.1 hypothetical protein D7319_20410 [Streptomyces radicis]RKN15116.1 hypothetical protein D7318_28280 [Streptomyces radicis]